MPCRRRRRFGAGAGGLPILFGWNPETAAALPATSTFTRASVKQVLTKTTTLNWYQEIKSGETPLDGLRRVENFTATGTAADVTLITGVTRSGDDLTFPGSSAAEAFTLGTGFESPANQALCFRFKAKTDSGTATFTIRELSGSTAGAQSITVTTTEQIFTLRHADTAASFHNYQVLNDDAGGPYNVTLTVTELSLSNIQSVTSAPDPFVDPATEYLNIGVDGVRYFNTTNGNSVDGSGVVTEATGTTITDGGYLPEPAATNQLLRSNDIGNASWTKENVTVAAQGANSLGLQEDELDAGTNTTFHRIYQPAATGGAGSAYCIAKQGTGRYIILRRGATADGYAAFDLQLGAITEEGAGIDDALITDLGDGYYKCEVNTSDTDPQFYVYISDVGNPGSDSRAWTGANETVLVCQEQWENTVYSTSPIVTAGATVTRVAEVLDTGSVIASAFGALLDVTLPLVIASGATISLLGPDATAEDILRVDASFNIIMDDGGTPATIGTSSAGSRIKVSYGRDGTGRSGSLDGATVVTGDAPGAGHEGDTFQLGAANSVNQSRCIHHLTTIYSIRPSDSQLRGLSS